MAVVPNMWGVWNMLHLALRSRLQWSIGVHGAILPLLLMPLGYALARVARSLSAGAVGVRVADGAGWRRRCITWRGNTWWDF